MKTRSLLLCVAMLSALLLFSCDNRNGNTLVEPNSNVDSLTKLADESEFWATPDSMITEGDNAVISMETIEELARESETGVGTIRIRQLRSSPIEDVVYIEVTLYAGDIENNTIADLRLQKRVFYEVDRTNNSKKAIDGSTTINVDSELSKILGCSSWPGVPQDLYAGHFYSDPGLQGDGLHIATGGLSYNGGCCGWYLGVYYVYIYSVEAWYTGMGNAMSSAAGDLDYTTQTCGGTIYRRFAQTDRIYFYKDTGFGGGYTWVDFAIVPYPSPPPFHILGATSAAILFLVNFAWGEGWNDNVESVISKMVIREEEI